MMCYTRQAPSPTGRTTGPQTSLARPYICDDPTVEDYMFESKMAKASDYPYKFPIKQARETSKKLIYGVGVNDADYATQPMVYGARYHCAFYETWKGTIRRVSAEIREKRPSYKDVTICNEWLTFSNFRRWMVSKNWYGRHLDKDLLTAGSRKIYSPSTCVFVSADINNITTGTPSKQGVAQGVVRRGRRYLAQISMGKNTKHLGMFDTEKEAETVYLEAKIAKLSTLISVEADSDVRVALQNYLRYVRTLKDE